MSAYIEVIKWSQCLPLWQRDALRRLAMQTSISTTDIEQLAIACEAEANQQTVSHSLVPMDDSHVPARASGTPTVTISGISASKSLNAIADGQCLTFGTDGLTIIYGDNGTGKSGFARVLRDACCARGTTDQVLPDVYAAQSASPSARVEFLSNDQPMSFDWKQDVLTSPKELHDVAVFDSNAAGSLIERDNEVLWTPGGLDLLVRLVAVVDKIRDHLQQSAHSVATPGTLPQVPNGTSAATFIGQLSANTQAAEIDALQLTLEEQVELKHLDAALTTSDPAAMVTQMRQRNQRFKVFRDRIARIENSLSQTALQEIANMRAAYQAAVDAENSLASQTFGDSLVPGVGDSPWRALWQAAENYAVSGATPDRIFPSSKRPSVCVLCQQPLTDATRERLTRFYTFVRADVAQTRVNAADALRKRINEIRNLRVREHADGPLIEELTAIHAENGKNLAQVLDVADAAVTLIAALVPEGTSSHMPDPLPVGWTAWLDSVIADTETRVTAVLEASKPDHRATSDIRRNELLARQALIAGRPLIEAEVQRLTRRVELEKSIASCVTNGITLKAGELTRTYVSDRLMAAFKTEANNLRLPMTVSYCHSRNEKGTSYQRVVLNTAQWAEKAGVPIQILSEGERRAVSLSAFFAELITRDDRSGVVLDDPVSSLDHERRNIVARRLVKLAAEQQVVVFTHDLVFLHMLKSTADEEGITVTDREVRRTTIASGICRDKPPVKAMRIKALISELKERQQQCTVEFSAGRMTEYENNLANTFGILREAWERAVEELLLNQAVMRFDHRVQTQRLKKVHDIIENDLSEIETGMSVCSKWLPGHAQASAINDPLPEPGELLTEIQRLESFVEVMRKRGRS